MTSKEQDSSNRSDQVGRQFTDECTNCGLCLEVCPFFPSSKFADKGPQNTIEKVTSLLKGGDITEEAYEMAYSCARGCSRLCAKACAVGLSPRDAFVSTRPIMASAGRSAPAPQYYTDPAHRYYYVRVLSALQPKFSDARWFNTVPADPIQADVVFYPGCATSSMAHLTMDIMGLLDKMGINHVTLAGGDLCCGIGYSLVGDPEAAQDAGRQLVAAISAFRPKKVLNFCVGCHVTLGTRLPKQVDVPFESQWLPEFLLENVEKLPFEQNPGKKVAVHDSCATTLSPDGPEVTRKLIQAIPGATLVEMEHNRANALCCGGNNNIARPEVGRHKRSAVMAEAAATGADVLATHCSGCHKALSRLEHGYPFEVKNYVSLLAEAVGIRHEDTLKKYANYRNLDKVLAESRDCIEASDFTLEEMRRILPGYL